MLKYKKRSIQKKLGVLLAVFGVSVWVSAAVLHIRPADVRDVAIGHIEARSLGIVGGGISVAGGIVLLAAAA